jgi:hypothetical protein
MHFLLHFGLGRAHRSNFQRSMPKLESEQLLRLKVVGVEEKAIYFSGISYTVSLIELRKHEDHIVKHQSYA